MLIKLYCDYYSQPLRTINFSNDTWTTLEDNNGLTSPDNQTQFLVNREYLDGNLSSIDWISEARKSGLGNTSVLAPGIQLGPGATVFGVNIFNQSLVGNTIVIQMTVDLDQTLVNSKQLSGYLKTSYYEAIIFSLPYGVNITLGASISAIVDGNPTSVNVEYDLNSTTFEIGIPGGRNITFNPVVFESNLHVHFRNPFF